MASTADLIEPSAHLLERDPTRIPSCLERDPISLMPLFPFRQ
jgi:hypothetical protein